MDFDDDLTACARLVERVEAALPPLAPGARTPANDASIHLEEGRERPSARAREKKAEGPQLLHIRDRVVHRQL